MRETGVRSKNDMLLLEFERYLRLLAPIRPRAANEALQDPQMNVNLPGVRRRRMARSCYFLTKAV